MFYNLEMFRGDLIVQSKWLFMRNWFNANIFFDDILYSKFDVMLCTMVPRNYVYICFIGNTVSTALVADGVFRGEIDWSQWT